MSEHEFRGSTRKDGLPDDLFEGDAVNRATDEVRDALKRYYLGNDEVVNHLIVAVKGMHNFSSGNRVYVDMRVFASSMLLDDAQVMLKLAKALYHSMRGLYDVVPVVNYEDGWGINISLEVDL